MWWISLRGEVNVLIELLDMWGGVYMSKIFFISLCLSYTHQSWWGGTSFFMLWLMCPICWIGVFRSMGCNGRVVYIFWGRVHMWFWNQGSVPLCYHLALLLRALFYCGGDIGRKWVSIFVWWFGWPIWVPFFLLPVLFKYVWYVCVRYLGIKPKIIYSQPMGRMSECIVSFGHCGRSFSSPVMYRSALTKRVNMSGSVFRISSHFHNSYTDAFHLSLLPLWVHWYICCIFYGTAPQCR